MFPLLLDLTDRLVLVVGGGPVARRKAQAVRVSGGKVRLVCLEARPADLTDTDIDWRQEAFAPSHLDGVALVVTAATATVDAAVTAEAKRRGLWVNVAGDPPAGNMQLPAVLRRGDLLVAVGTHGAAPALARRVRDRLDELLDPGLAEWVGLLGELRPAVLSLEDPVRRRAVLERLAEWEWLDRLRTEGVESVRQAMRKECSG